MVRYVGNLPQVSVQLAEFSMSNSPPVRNVIACAPPTGTQCRSQIQNKPLLNGTIPGQADWTRLRPQRWARRGNPDAVHCPTPSGILDYIGLSVPQRWGRFFDALTVDLAY